MFELIDSDVCLSVGHRDEPVEIKVTHINRPLRCHCGRFVSKKTRRCSLEKQVYQYGTFAGWEHY